MALLVGVPEGSLPEFGIAIVAFLDSEGETRVGAKPFGDMGIYQLVGMMDYVKFLLLANDYNSDD